MKISASFFILFVLMISCTGPANTGDRKANSDHNSLVTSTITTPVSPADSGMISVVHRLVPVREITVGGNGADVRGFTSMAIQTAIDAVNSMGGGTVKLLPGNFDIIAPVTLYDNMVLKGSGPATVLKKCPGVRSNFAFDADYGELQVTVSDASGFRPGMAVSVFDDRQRSGWDVTTAKITRIKDNTIFIDDYLVRDYQAEDNGTVSNACSVIAAIAADNVTISDLTVDGSKDSNDKVDGCRVGGIYLHKVRNALVENVVVKDFNSDGISWQITEYVTVRNCTVYGCTNAGLHPGTGSPFTLIEGNDSHDNGGFGLYVCWRVRNGKVINNSFHHNGTNGICTGHKDTDMVFAGNHVYENGSDGINLRDDGPFNSPHRNIFRKNLIENNGPSEDAYGISVTCPAEGVVIEDNIIRTAGSAKQLAAVFLSAKSLPVEIRNNQISGHRGGEVVKEADR